MHISDVRTGRDELDFGVAQASSLDLDWETCLKVLQGHCPVNTRLIRTAVLDGARTHASYFNAGVRSGSLGGLCRFTQDHALLVKYINLFFSQFFKMPPGQAFASRTMNLRIYIRISMQAVPSIIRAVSVPLRRADCGS